MFSTVFKKYVPEILLLFLKFDKHAQFYKPALMRRFLRGKMPPEKLPPSLTYLIDSANKRKVLKDLTAFEKRQNSSPAYAKDVRNYTARDILRFLKKISKLRLQRTNLQALLSLLVKEGLLEKSEGYSLSSKGRKVAIALLRLQQALE